MNTITIKKQMFTNRQKKRRLPLKTLMVAMFLALFTQFANAQVYMHDGNSYVGNSGVKFYDSGGPSKGPANFWLHWFGRNQDFTYTFNPETAGYAIQVDFGTFTAYTDNNGANDPHALLDPSQVEATFSLRLNDAELSIYDGAAVDESKLITTLTGTIYEPFTVMANGPITFRFKSYSYTEEGWGATVKQVAASEYKLQKPAISMEVCSDLVILYPTTLGASIRYTTNGTTPSATNGTVYSYPFALDSYPTNVKAVTVNGNNYSVEVADKTYNDYDATPVPNISVVPIERDGNTIIINPGEVPDHLNETYAVIYTYATNGGTPEDPVYLGYQNPENVGTYLDPDGWNGSMPGLVHFDWNTPNTNFKFRIVAKTCVKQSAVKTYQFGKLQVPDPELTISDNGDNTGAADITWESGYVIRYTTDGSNPTTTNGTLVSSGTSVSVSPLAPGTNVKVVAYKLTNGEVDANYDLSNVINEMYLPGGGNSGTYGGIVILNDFEDHSWSYYSDGDQPIHSLKPADVKITYTGYGPNTMTSTSTANMPAGSAFDADVTSSQVAVNTDAPENQFIYLKTLENANADGSGNYPYTMIPNPFQVRPKYEESGGGGTSAPTIDVTIGSGNNTAEYLPTYNYYNYSLSEQIYLASEIGSAGTIRTISFRVSSNASSRNMTIYLMHTNKANFTGKKDWVSVSSSNQVYSGAVSFINGWTEITLDTPFEYNGTSNLILAVDDNSNSSAYYSSRMYFYTYNSNNDRVLYYYSDNTNPNPSNFSSNGTLGTYLNQVKFSGGSSSSSSEYRGFYAWRVKSLSDGLSIKAGANTYTSSNINNNSIIYADQEVEFITSNTKGNEVEFEALWAQAYVNSSSYVSNSGDYKNAYERNFKVGTSLNTYTYPVTISCLNPDGTGTVSNVTRSSNYTATNDVKIENMNLRMSDYYINGAGYNLTIGRGVQYGGTSTNNVASAVYGYYSDDYNATPSFSHDFTVRVESGRYQEIYALRGNGVSYTSGTSYVTTTSSAFTENIVLGSDYDRANGNTNTKLYSIETTNVSKAFDCSNESTKLNMHILSGTFGTNDADKEVYVGFENHYSHNCLASRLLEVLGGDLLGGIAGGIEYGVSSSTEILKIRIKGGTIHRYLYGSGQYSAGYGTRKTIITGGTFDGWIAGGCYGTESSGGATDGDVSVYFGGKANQTSDAGLFGSGYGTAEVYGTDDENSYYVNASTVVVADQAQVAGSVYGGGNNGFAQNSSDVHILGGTISGNVFGGANKSKGATITVNVKGGTIAGNVYGGSDTKGVISELATVNVSDGTVTDVFGGGLGEDTDMSKGTAVNISGGTINNNVYGGGEKGTVSDGGTQVNVSGGTMKDVYGAGKGESAATGSKATVTGQTFVNVTGGTIANVYGGGENGNIVAGTSSGSTGEILTYDFEDGTLQGWTAFDADNDGYTWQQHTNTGSGNYTTHAGDGCVTSASYINDVGPLTPNNWLISPMIKLGGSISFWAVAQSSDYPNEHYAVYVSTTGTAVSDFTIISDEFVATGSYIQRSVDLSSYSGNGYVAIRHFNCTDQFYLNVDDITITQPAQQQGDASLASTVTINGGNISENVFGGGAYGTTDGNTIVNVKNGSVHGSVYGGALGNQGSVYVAGSHTVNVLGGRVYSNVYGGSRNANDALSFDPGTFADSNGNVTADDEETVCVVNISGGQIDQQVYAAGYYGNCFGSVYAFIGKNAIYNAPHHVETANAESAGEEYTIAKLSIAGSVWAGGDWGTFTDTFGKPTISGNSNVYIDGQDYITNTSDKSTVGYMGIDGSVYGSGTSCDAGNKEHTVMLRNYGESSEPYEAATRDFASIQRADYLVLDNVHLHNLGQGKVNSLNVTEVYSIYEVSEAVIMTGGSTLIMDAPVDQIKSFWSASCGDVYTAALPTSQTAVGGYTALDPSTLSATPNKVRVNGGNYIKIYHDKQIASGSGSNVTYTPGYGMLNGYAYMMASSGDNEATCAYARPRWCYKNTDAMFPINDANYDNRNDGGWVSYVSGDNVFDLAGNAGTVQMEYENHTPGSKVGEQYFRIWRSTGQIHERERIFDVVATGEDEFRYVDVEIELPAWRGNDYYYMFERQGTAPNYSTTIDYGTELMTFNTALYDDDSWIYYDPQTKAQVLGANSDEQDEIKAQPNVNYGLAILPGTGNALSSPQIGSTPAPALIINGDSDEFLVKEGQNGPVNTFTFENNVDMPTVTFRLTYSDLITSNKTYEPIWVNLVQCDKNGNVKDIVKVKLIVNTSTTVGRNFKAQVYAVMNGNGATAEETHVQVVLPRFTLNQGGVDSRFTVESIEWTPANTSDGAGELVTVASNSFDKTKFAMEFSASDNYDGTTGWNELDYAIYDTKVLYGPTATTPKEMGTTSGRSQFSFDFNLYYNGQNKISVTQPELMGTLVYHMRFTNYGTTSDAYPNGSQDFTITIEVYRRGVGTRYYLDGVNGKNSNPGDKPDKAMLTLNAIFNRSGFLPGDEIYVVNKVTAEDGLEWNGLAKGGNVMIYRYNGGHPLSTTTTTDPETGDEVTVTGSIIGNPNNEAYTGALVEVPAGATMTVLGITMDGYYNNGVDTTDYSTVAAASPLFNVEGTLALNQNVTLQQNYNTNNGGAVYVNEGGTLMMNEDAKITNNKSEYDGAGVYMNGTMIVSDQVVVWDNMGNGNTQNNVYLASKASMVQIGVDADSEQYQDLAYDAEHADQSAKIGVTKSTSNFTAGVAEVVYSNETSWLTEPLETQAIIVHDGGIYNLETGASANILYWRDTWVTFVTSQPEGFAINNIDSEEDLAWVISLVNGENGQSAHTYAGETIVVKKNLDMGAHTWVPIGERNDVFKGTFEGNGYTIEGLNSSLNRTDLGMFGIAEGATIQNVIAQCTFDGIANNYGTIAGTMKGGTISNVEAAGTLTGDATYAQHIGGLVGVTETGTTIQSSFAVNDITAQRDETVIGGLVGTNNGNLYNSYANTTLNGTTNTVMGGLVGENNAGGVVENCYSVRQSDDIQAFAAVNDGNINYCYFNKNNDVALEQVNYHPTGTGTLLKPGYYAMVPKTGLYGYMYYDNIVHDIDGGSPYIPTEKMSYANGQIDKWPGLLSVLNQWVDGHDGYTSWLRPTTKSINQDLPVLTFETGNAMGTTDGKFLRYSVTSETNNGLDDLLEYYGGKTSYIFLYANATKVAKVPGQRTNVFINEDAVLLQADNAGDFINTTVGVSFDNSYKNATDYWGQALKYDWHFFSTPLADAPMGIEYNSNEQNWWETDDQGQVT